MDGKADEQKYFEVSDLTVVTDRLKDGHRNF